MFGVTPVRHIAWEGRARVAEASCHRFHSLEKERIVKRIQAIQVTGVFCVAAILGVGSAQADTIYWDGSGTTWNVVSSWSTDLAGTTDPTAIPGIGDDVIFSASTVAANQALTLNANQSAGALTFNNTTGLTTTITGTSPGSGNRDLTIGSGGIEVAAGSGQVVIGTSAANQNIFVKLDASQTWTNNSSSLLQARNSVAGSLTAAGPVVWTFNAAGSGTIQNSGALSDGNTSVSVVVQSTGTGVVSLGGGTYTGGTTIKYGALNTGSAGTGDILIGDTVSTLDAIFRLEGSNNLVNNIILQPGSTNNMLQIRTGGGTNPTQEFSGTIAMNANNLNVMPTGSNSMTFSNVVSGSGNITKIGTTLILSGANTFTGKMTVATGTLSVGSLNSVVGGSASSNLGAPVTVANGTIDLGTTGTATLLYTGAGETTDRVLNLAGTSGVTLNQSGTGLLNFTSDLTGTGSGNKTLTLTGSTDGIGRLGGAVVNSLGTTTITKTGTGTWILAGTNTNTGQTNVNGGTLLINGVTGSGNVIVSSGGTLGGTGTVTSSVTVNAGGFLAPGASIESLDIGGNATINGTLLIELDGTGAGSSDLLAVNGTLNIINATVDFTQLAAVNDPVYVFATYGSLTGTEFAAVNNLPTNYVIDYAYNSSNQIALVLIPEPGSLALLAVGTMLIVSRKRVRNA
jgi:autotransporter-associated beta strand protein